MESGQAQSGLTPSEGIRLVPLSKIPEDNEETTKPRVRKHTTPPKQVPKKAKVSNKSK